MAMLVGFLGFIGFGVAYWEDGQHPVAGRHPRRRPARPRLRGDGVGQVPDAPGPLRRGAPRLPVDRGRARGHDGGRRRARRHGGPAAQAARRPVRRWASAVIGIVARSSPSSARSGPSRPRARTHGRPPPRCSRPTGGRAASWSTVDGPADHRRRPRRGRHPHRLPPGLRRLLGRPGHPDPPGRGPATPDLPGPHRLGRGRLRGVLQAVHPPGLPGRALPAADPAAGLPLPPVDVQRR